MKRYYSSPPPHSLLSQRVRLPGAGIQHEIAEQKTEAVTYTFPPIELLKNVDNEANAAEAEAEMKTNADTLVDTLKSFGVQTRMLYPQ